MSNANKYFSIIIPVLNEALTLTYFLKKMQFVRDLGHEIIVVDGGSFDASRELAAPLTDRVLCSAKGRSVQMRAGAANARHELLWFVHLDTEFEDRHVAALMHAITDEGKLYWGWFDIVLSNSDWPYKIISFMMNWRSRLTYVATGDQGIFVSRALYNEVGGYPNIALMEDVALCKRLRLRGLPLRLGPPLLASSRRWEHHGVVKTIFLMWFYRLAYVLGVSPKRLQRWYYA